MDLHQILKEPSQSLKIQLLGVQKPMSTEYLFTGLLVGIQLQ